MTPAPNALRRRLLKLAGLVVFVGLALSAVLFDQLVRVHDTATFDDPEEHFKYGSLTVKPGFPYYLWAVMPEVFADLLPRPGGWEVFGFIEESGRGYPVGFARQTVGFPGLTPNCALCHAGAYRASADAAPSLVPTAPAGALDFQAFNEFVFRAVADERFTPAVLVPAIRARFDLSPVEALVYRWVLLPAVRRTLREQARGAAWMNTRPRMGRGRFDAFNLFKISVLGLPDDGTVGASDYPPLWNHGAREGLYLHWNGSSNQLAEDDRMSVYPLNQGARGFRPESFERVRSYLANRPPPAFPFAVDSVRAARGEALFERECARCHDAAGALGRVTSQAELGTDPEFLSMWSEAFVTALKAIDSPPFSFPSLRRTDGYVNVPLDGLWMRAPYLHNGSVPTLWHLLAPAEERPARFYRGSDVYDPAPLGFLWDVSEGEPVPSGWTEYDTGLRGNRNGGHEYGVTLSETMKRDLIEYLKTL